MPRQKLIHEILADIISGIVFTVSFKSVTDNGGGSYTLNDVCNFHHIQPGTTITINSNDYTVISYSYSNATITVNGANSIGVNSFNLPVPLFVHGTPVQQENELAKIDLNIKTPMIYLMEPYETEDDFSNGAAIAYRSVITLCFLTDMSEAASGLTDDIYYNAIYPMQNLSSDFIQAMEDSYLFNNTKQKAKPTFYTKFGINIKMQGTDKLLFSQFLSGVGLEIKLEVYADLSCPCGQVGSFSDGFNDGF